ncbi:MAG: pro-sigmaK processing inhibitor BofA family protein [Oscillospiraceae bacterium]|nr:pro-sigmaK processing inhibitor BofA family protein [Oscillospiraceae bacterium]
MTLTQQLLIGGCGLALLLAALRLFTAPVRRVFKVLLNTALGFAGLLVFNLAAPALGLHVELGLNLLNAAVVALLGLPGFALLLLLRVM